VELFGISNRVAIVRKVTNLTTLLKNKAIEDANLEVRFYILMVSLISSLD
jgi:hypothetical protein